MTDPTPAEFDIEPAKPSFWRNLSFVWLVPLVALAASLALAWQSFADRGVAIEITFANASGIAAGETTIRYRDVVVGTVEDVTFTSDLARVLVRARVDKEVAPYLDENAQFWVVSPKVSARGITGLSTVLSGVYIEGAWDQVIGAQKLAFVGSDSAPLVQPGRAGKRITLMSRDGRLLSEGAPVFFHGIEVGRIEKPRLTVSTDTIVADAFIEAPHDRRLNLGTRFWDKSGFSVTLSGAGLNVDFDSLSSLVAGGLEFDSIYEGGELVGPGHVFSVFENEGDARKSLFLRSNAEAVEIAAEFGESVSGLEPGADVRFGGLKVGQVVAISAQVLETEFGPEIRPMARLAIEPDRLGLPRGSARDDVLDFFDAAVAKGLRARLATTSLFSNALVVDLVEVPDAGAAMFQRDAKPLPVMPSVTSNLPDFTATAEGMFERINNLPVEALIEQAISVMASVEAVARKDSTLNLPDTVTALLDDTRALVNDEATKALPGELRDTVAELRAVVTELKERGAVDNLVTALERADDMVANLTAASQDFPALVEELRAVAQKAADLKAEDLVAAATKVLDSAQAVIGTEAAQQLPAALDAALAEVRAAVGDLRGMVAELNEGDVVGRLVSALEQADTAATNAATASQDFPILVEELRTVVAKANALKADELVAAATKVLDSADAVIGTEAAQQLPGTLNAALDEVRTALGELRAGGVVENANATMASAREASEAVAEAAAGLPDLAAQLDRLVKQAEALISAYGTRSDFNDETLAALREVRGAARAVNQLARTLERDPGMLIRGR